MKAHCCITWPLADVLRANISNVATGLLETFRAPRAIIVGGGVTVKYVKMQDWDAGVSNNNITLAR